MGALILIPILVLLLVGWASYAISAVVVKRVVNTENTNVKLLRGLIMGGSFVIIMAAILILFVSNMSFER